MNNERITEEQYEAMQRVGKLEKALREIEKDENYEAYSADVARKALQQGGEQDG